MIFSYNLLIFALVFIGTAMIGAICITIYDIIDLCKYLKKVKRYKEREKY